MALSIVLQCGNIIFMKYPLNHANTYSCGTQIYPVTQHTNTDAQCSDSYKDKKPLLLIRHGPLPRPTGLALTGSRCCRPRPTAEQEGELSRAEPITRSVWKLPAAAAAAASSGKLPDPPPFLPRSHSQNTY